MEKCWGCDALVFDKWIGINIHSNQYHDIANHAINVCDQCQPVVLKMIHLALQPLLPKEK